MKRTDEKVLSEKEGDKMKIVVEIHHGNNFAHQLALICSLLFP